MYKNIIISSILLFAVIVVYGQNKVGIPSASNFQILKEKPQSSKYNNLYQIGIADAFVNGLYNGNFYTRELTNYGDFGLGAPDMIDGELTLSNGKIYQFKSNGITIEAPPSLKTPFAFVVFFKPDTSFDLTNNADQQDVYNILQKYLRNKNGMYAIRITGRFIHVKTRAFPAETKVPYPPLSEILEKQHFFEYQNIDGSLIGYWMPSYLSGLNIAGFHFHFLADQLNGGGHVLAFSTLTVKVEIAYLNTFTLLPPDDEAFRNYNFKETNSNEMKKVEQGH